MKKIIFLFVISSLFSFNTNNNVSRQSLVSLPKSNVCANGGKEYCLSRSALNDTLKMVNDILLVQGDKSKSMDVDKIKPKKVVYEKTKVSYYGEGDGFHGKTMANGKKFNKNDLTAATGLNGKVAIIPLGSWVQVTNLNNGKTVIVQITDTGGFRKHGRGLDLSSEAFRQLTTKSNLDKGVLQNVKVELLHGKPNVI